MLCEVQYRLQYEVYKTSKASYSWEPEVAITITITKKLQKTSVSFQVWVIRILTVTATRLVKSQPKRVPKYITGLPYIHIWVQGWPEHRQRTRISVYVWRICKQKQCRPCTEGFDRVLKLVQSHYTCSDRLPTIHEGSGGRYSMRKSKTKKTQFKVNLPGWLSELVTTFHWLCDAGKLVHLAIQSLPACTLSTESHAAHNSINVHVRAGIMHILNWNRNTELQNEFIIHSKQIHWKQKTHSYKYTVWTNTTNVWYLTLSQYITLYPYMPMAFQGLAIIAKWYLPISW